MLMVQAHAWAERVAPRMKKQNTTNVEPEDGLPSPEQLEEKIRQRAHELYELRGREHGHDLDDWLEAESELTATCAK